MNNLISLRSLLNKLTEEEKKVLKRILNSKYSGENKSLLLVNLLLIEPILNSSDIQKRIYNKINYSAFNKLCSRLREKILDSILLESSIDNGGYSKRNKIIFENKKKLIQADILNLKGLREQADVICKKVISLSNEYEIYDLTIQSLITREKFIRLRKNHKEIDRIFSEINISNLKLESFRKCQSEFNAIMNKIASAGNELSYFAELKELILKLQDEYNKYKSNSTGYYLQILITQKHQIEYNFKEADLSLDIALSMLKSKSVYSDNRYGSVLLSKSENYIKLHDFDKAVKFTEDAITYFPNNIFNKALVYECRFYANFFSGNFIKSQSDINYLCGLPKENNILVSIDKWNYLAAILLFLEKKYKECMIKLHQINEIDKDKEGWNVNIRLLIILCQIEMEETELVDLSITNLEKFIRRSKSKANLPSRYKIILKVLISLSNENYDFEKVTTKKGKYLEMLNQKANIFSWIIKGPELIPFNIWFMAKQNRRGDLYEHLIATL